MSWMSRNARCFTSRCRCAPYRGQSSHLPHPTARSPGCHIRSLSVLQFGGEGPEQAAETLTLLQNLLKHAKAELVNAGDREKRTALHWAVGKNATACVTALVEVGRTLNKIVVPYAHASDTNALYAYVSCAHAPYAVLVELGGEPREPCVRAVRALLRLYSVALTVAALLLLTTLFPLTALLPCPSCTGWR